MIVLEKNGKVALVDTGFSEQFEQLTEYLDRMGVKRIEFILLTHFHRDHYGNIPALLKRYEVLKVYLKEYSALDSTTAWGTAADDAYRMEEQKKYLEMQEFIWKKSTLASVEGLEEINFEGTRMKLYSADNSVRFIFEDESQEETFHKILFSENQNSLAVFFECNGKTVFLGGDMMDLPSSHPRANFVNTQIARKIGKKIDVYKVPHHGTVHTGSREALEIYKPSIAIITNEDEYLKSNSDVYSNLKNANPDVKIILTEKQDVVIDLEKPGN